jgi:hypothetical protein
MLYGLGNTRTPFVVRNPADSAGAQRLITSHRHQGHSKEIGRNEIIGAFPAGSEPLSIVTVTPPPSLLSIYWFFFS